MALRHAILAALLEGDATGYELSKRFDVAVSNFWTATPPQLYRELELMAGDGLLDAQLVEQERRPNKRLFSVTEAGLAELAEFAQRPTRPTAIRDELLVKLQGIDVSDHDAVRSAIAERVELARAKLALYDTVRTRMLGGMSEREFLERAPRVGPYLTLMRGRSFERENIAWGRRVLEILAARAGTSA